MSQTTGQGSSAANMSTDRQYNPFQIWGDKLNMAKLEDPSASTDFVYTPCSYCGFCAHCGYHQVSTKGIIIAVSGACRPDGKPNAKAGYGVYFNASSSLNFPQQISNDKASIVPTSQRAGVLAASAALATFKEKVLDNPESGQDISNIVIKSHSAELVHGIAIHIERWRMNGHKTTRGPPLANWDLFRLLGEQIVFMKDRGVDVRFWLVSGYKNQQAAWLTHAAISGDDWKQTTKDNFLDAQWG